MIQLVYAEFLFALIVLFTAYFISHTINGYLQSWIISKLGDDTAKEVGYMSLNPWMHIDLFGILALVFLGIGWLQTVPIDPYAFIGSWRYLRLLLAYFTESFISIGIASIALFFNVYMFGYYLTNHLIVKLFNYYSNFFLVLFKGGPHLNLASLFTQQQSPASIAIALLLVTLVYFNILVATISIIFNTFRYALVVGFERGYSYIEYAEFVSLLGPFLAVYVLGNWLISYLLTITSVVAYNIAHLVGV